MLYEDSRSATTEHHGCRVFAYWNFKKIDVSFLQLRTVSWQQTVNVALFEGLKKVGTAYQGSVFIFASRRLNVMTMSTAYAAVSIIPLLRKAFCNELAGKTYTLLQFLEKFVPLPFRVHQLKQMENKS